MGLYGNHFESPMGGFIHDSSSFLLPFMTEILRIPALIERELGANLE